MAIRSSPGALTSRRDEPILDEADSLLRPRLGVKGVSPRGGTEAEVGFRFADGAAQTLLETVNHNEEADGILLEKMPL